MSAEALLLHLSDPHFGTERPAVAAALLRLAAGLRPSLVVLSGDITQRPRAAQFGAARAFVDRLAGPAPLLAIPGNHDLPLFDLARRAFAPYARFRRAFGGPEVFESPALVVVAVDTTRPWLHKNGVVSPAQVEAAARRLEAAPGERLRVVVVHQPVAVTRPEDEKNLLRNHAAAVRRWSSAGADLVLGGHIHLPYVLPMPAPRRIWAVNAGTALSTRVRREAANSVNLIRYDGARGCVVERWDYRAAADGFEAVERHALALERGG